MQSIPIPRKEHSIAMPVTPPARAVISDTTLFIHKQLFNDDTADTFQELSCGRILRQTTHIFIKTYLDLCSLRHSLYAQPHRLTELNFYAETFLHLSV